MDEKYHEQAQALEQQRRDAALQAASRACGGTGRATCYDCDEPIEAKRRKAAPSAIRCINCQRIFEHHKKGY
jgi:phage/conjugal plasmid C-4 type zinc finger TraR family protein